MTALFGQLMMAICGAFLTLLIFVLTMVIQNLPAIIRLLEGIWTVFLQLSYQVYHFALDILPSAAGTNGPIGTWRVVATSLLSLGIYLATSHLLGASLNVWIAGLSLAHGLYIGLAWDQLADPNGLHLGTRMQ